MIGEQPRWGIYEQQNPENKTLLKSQIIETTFYEELRTPGSTRAKHSWRTRFSGWRGGILGAIVVSTLVLFLNIILAILASTKWRPAEGIATAFDGDCTSASRWIIAIHLFVNLLSSLLLGASNYCMQRLVAPTRKEIDKAHARRKWLDIGIPSIRNLNSISKLRLLPWILLAFSSIPLHFLYNSIIFEAVGANHVDFLVVTEEFFTNKHSWDAGMLNPDFDNGLSRLQNTLLDGKYLDRTVFENITDSECKSRYKRPFIRHGPGFGIMTLESLGSYYIESRGSLQDSSEGIGGLGPSFDGNERYSYCLSRKVPPPKCKLQINQNLLNVVIACNVIKIATMVFVLFYLNQETIVTIGDAIKSFVSEPDSTTMSCCLMSRRTIGKLWETPELRVGQHFNQTKMERWGVACSKRRWIVSTILYLGTIIVAVIIFVFMGMMRSQPSEGSSALFGNGFGTISTDFLIDIDLPYGETSVIPYVLLANSPQALLSFIYIAYNGQFTAMLAHREWSNYAIKRAPLRVTLPSIGQRSTYYLQLPYTFGVPLMVTAIILHWFVSQAIFLVRIIAYADGKPTHMSIAGSQQGDFFSAVGYSNSAFIASIGWGTVLVVAIITVALFGKYPVGLPTGGMNSAVISAACHLEHDGRGAEDISDRPLKWGVTIPGSKEVAGHCSFSSGEVQTPEIGHLYAGWTLTNS